MSIESLSAVVADLVAIEAIKSLKNKYFRALDQQLFDEVASCFSRGAVIDYGAAGVYTEVADFVTMISEYANSIPHLDPCSSLFQNLGNILARMFPTRDVLVVHLYASL